MRHALTRARNLVLTKCCTNRANIAKNNYETMKNQFLIGGVQSQATSDS